VVRLDPPLTAAPHKHFHELTSAISRQSRSGYDDITVRLIQRKRLMSGTGVDDLRDATSDDAVCA
jgi:hypothetical protein